METYVEHAAELWTQEGPTGDHVEVIRGQVQDYGGNVLFEGTPNQCVDKKWKVPVRFVATEWKRVGVIVGCDHQWDLVTE